MKRIIFSIVVVALSIGNYAQENNSWIEGAWTLVKMINSSGVELFPAQFSGEQVKVFIDGQLIWAGQYTTPNDTTIYNDIGLGTYTLDGNKFVEKTRNRVNTEGTRMIMEIRNDTLFQMWPTDENFNLLETHSTYKYIRLK